MSDKRKFIFKSIIYSLIFGAFWLSFVGYKLKIDLLYLLFYELFFLVFGILRGLMLWKYEK